MNPLKKLDIRQRQPGLSAYLNYCAFVRDGVMIQKDGSFLTGFAYVGPDLDSAMPEDIIRLSNAANRAVGTLGHNYVLHVNAIRRDASGYPAKGAFPDRTTWLIDEERRKMASETGSQFDSIYIITISYMPPSEASERTENWLFDDSGQKKAPHKKLDERLEEFEVAVSSFLSFLSGADVSVRRMDSHELLTFIHSCITGLPHPVRVPLGIQPYVKRFIKEEDNDTIPPPLYTFLDTVVSSQDFIGGFEPQIGDNYIGIVAITGLPSETTPGILDVLNRLQSGYRWNTRFMAMGTTEAGKELQKLTRQWLRKQYSMFSMIKSMISKDPVQLKAKPEVEEKLEQLEALKAANNDMELRIGYYNTEIILYNPDKNALKAEVSYIRQRLGELGFATRLEKENAVRSFLGSLPGDSYNNVRKIMFSSRNVVDLLPMTSVWSGHAYCKHLKGPALVHTISNSATPFRLNLHVEDVGHTMVIGPTGRGKSTLLMLLAAQFFRYPNAQVIAFDKGYSAIKLCLATGGKHYDMLSPEDPKAITLCPLKDIGESDVDMSWAVEYVSDIVRLQLADTDTEFGPEQVAAIRKALELLKEDPVKSLSRLYSLVQDKNVQMSLEPYLTKEGSDSVALLDAESDNIADSRFLVFETEHLLHMGDKIVVPTLQYLFRAIEKRLSGQPTLLILDEAWSLLSNPLFAGKIREWLKVLRKANVSVIFTSQSLDDVSRSAISSTLYESCPTKILLGSPQARSTSYELYRSIGLNDTEIAIVADAPQYSYFYTSPNGKRLFNLRLGPVQLAFVAGASPESTRKVRSLYKEHGEQWPYYYLNEIGMAEAALTWANAQN